MLHAMMRLSKFGISLSLLFPFMILSFDKKSQLEDRPNVIVILTDDQGWGDFSLHGNQNIRTPNLDRLANNGVQFDNFYVQPVCSPTRAEFLTGRYHARGGVYGTSTGGERLDLDETTIAEVFQNAGYTTAAYGKWHNGMQYPYHPNGRGFEDFYGFCSGHWGNYFSPMLEHNGKITNGEGFLTDDFTDHGLSFISENKDRPFFLYLAFNTPHAPMQVPDQWWNRVENRPLSRYASEGKQEDLTFTKAALAMCENIDWNIGRIVNKLRHLDLEENTIVVFFNDNGPNSFRWNAEMKGKKGSTDEGGVRSPLFIKWPAEIRSGKNIRQIAGAIDILPTLTDLVGIPCVTAKALDGRTLKPLILKENPPWTDRLLYHHWRGRLSVRSQKFRLDHEGNLFDIDSDRSQSFELNDIKSDIRQELMAAQASFRSEVLSEIPEEDPRAFLLGDPRFVSTQIPARDGIGHGNIERSDNSPNCSFFTNWISIEDSITWDIEVVEAGAFEVTLYYTCDQQDLGSEFTLQHGSNRLIGSVKEAFGSELRGMENDRVPRTNSYVKEFLPSNLGVMHLDKGRDKLTLKASHKPGRSVMDVRLIMFKRV